MCNRKCVDCFSWMPDFYLSGATPGSIQGTCRDRLSRSNGCLRSAQYSCEGFSRRTQPNPIYKAMDEAYRIRYVRWVHDRGDGVQFETREPEIRRKVKHAIRSLEAYRAEAAQQKARALASGMIMRQHLHRTLHVHRDLVEKLLTMAGVQAIKVPGVSAKFYTAADLLAIKAAYEQYLNDNPRCRANKAGYAKRKEDAANAQ